MQQFIKDERMFQAGLLALVMKMRKEQKSFDECFVFVQKKLRLEPEEFRLYVGMHLQSASKVLKNTVCK